MQIIIFQSDCNKWNHLLSGGFLVERWLGSEVLKHTIRYTQLSIYTHVGRLPSSTENQLDT